MLVVHGICVSKAGSFAILSTYLRSVRRDGGGHGPCFMVDFIFLPSLIRTFVSPFGLFHFTSGGDGSQ